MERTLEYWLTISLTVAPMLWEMVRWVWRKFFSIKRRALALEYIDSKQYFRKKNDKVELRVIYNNSIKCDSLVTLRIAIKNIGEEDIASSSLIDPVKISFSDKYEILDVSKVEEYHKIRPSIVFTKSTISLKWALLKHESNFEIDIIAKSTNNDRELSVNFYNSIACVIAVR